MWIASSQESELEIQDNNNNCVFLLLEVACKNSRRTSDQICVDRANSIRSRDLMLIHIRLLWSAIFAMPKMRGKVDGGRGSGIIV